MALISDIWWFLRCLGFKLGRELKNEILNHPTLFISVWVMDCLVGRPESGLSLETRTAGPKTSCILSESRHKKRVSSRSYGAGGQDPMHMSRRGALPLYSIRSRFQVTSQFHRPVPSDPLSVDMQMNIHVWSISCVSKTISMRYKVVIIHMAMPIAYPNTFTWRSENIVLVEGR